MSDLVFHETEQLLQKENGVLDKMKNIGSRIIKPYMIDEHKEFFSNLSYVFLALLGDNDDIWPIMLEGSPGFIYALSDTVLHINTQALPKDLLGLHCDVGSSVGVLGLDLSNRRRNRLNGTVCSVGDEGISIQVDQSFGNCPKYIQRRINKPVMVCDSEVQHKDIVEFDSSIMHIIARSDTFFMASGFMGSGGTAKGLDVSHRGGKPGFVRVQSRKQLWFNDYPGNSMFNTLGNTRANPNVGLLFVDFESRDLFMCTGKARIESFVGGDKPARRVEFTLHKGFLMSEALRSHWEFVDYSPAITHLTD